MLRTAPRCREIRDEGVSPFPKKYIERKTPAINPPELGK
jgi:hypothetical protein